jgi:hypothetical protein
MQEVPVIREMRTPSTVTTFGQMDEQPRVMIGITMGEAPAETLESLGIEGSAIRIDRVIEGLPAAEAGLKPGAIVVSIEGDEPATMERLREVLGGREPGDSITVEIVERGQRKELTIELVAYDAEALQDAMGEAPSGQGGAFTIQGQAGAHHEELNARIREAIEAMTESGVTEIDSDALRQKIEAIVRDHLAQFRGMEGFTYQIAPGAQNMPGRVLVAPGAHGGHGQHGEMLFVQPRMPAAPTPPSPPAPDGTAPAERRGSNVDARLNELSDRLTRLEERLDRLMQMMERGRD